jgi:hypothetical protein
MRSPRSLLLPALLAGVAAFACHSEQATAPAADPPAQFISVKRAWRPGERDSVLQFILATGAWGEYSDLAAEAVPQWDSAVDIIVNPAWSASAAASGVQRAPAFQATWSTAGIDVRIVYDSIPGGAIQRDSLNWKMLFWWNPADSTWKGYVVDATTAATFVYVTLNTTNFNSKNGKAGAGGGEARQRADSATYWEANGGQWRVTYNGSYGGLSVIGSGPFKGGNVQTGLMGGRLQAVTMPRISGTTLPTTQNITFDFSGNIYAQRMFCYYTPITPPSGYSSCTGSAIAGLVAAARAGRAMATLSGGGPTRTAAAAPAGDR